jgi:cation diffusion facilitator family transporter
MDSLSDAVVSGVNLLLVRHAASPPDPGHPYGHGKAEGLAGLAQGLVLAGIVVGLATAAAGRLVDGHAPAPLVGPAAAVMVASMAGAFAISRLLSRAADATGSLALRADATHYRMDLWTGGAVVAGLAGVALTGRATADAVATLVVCAVMSREVGGLLVAAVAELMDTRLPAEELAAVEDVLRGFRDRVVSWHDLRTRRAGPHRFVQVHVVLPRQLPFADAHRVTDDLEEALRGALPNADVLVHADPTEEHDRTDAR